MPLATEAGNFTVTVDVDLRDVESPSDAAQAIIEKLAPLNVRVLRISREYVPVTERADG